MDDRHYTSVDVCYQLLHLCFPDMSVEEIQNQVCVERPKVSIPDCPERLEQLINDCRVFDAFLRPSAGGKHWNVKQVFTVCEIINNNVVLSAPQCWWTDCRSSWLSWKSNKSIERLGKLTRTTFITNWIVGACFFYECIFQQLVTSGSFGAIFENAVIIKAEQLFYSIQCLKYCLHINEPYLNTSSGACCSSVVLNWK